MDLFGEFIPPVEFIPPITGNEPHAATCYLINLHNPRKLVGLLSLFFSADKKPRLKTGTPKLLVE